MARAVIFDFYGTLAHWRDRAVANYTDVLASLGYHLPDEELAAYFARYDGVAHAEHSVSEMAYEAWVRGRLRELATACGVASAECDAVIDALRASDHDPMVAYPEAAGTLRSLRHAGWLIGVCSNWGWQLTPFLQEVGLLDLVDSPITSARAGARKPHPSIFVHAAADLGVQAQEAVFVGDSWEPDVEGPRRAGMTAVHVWRDGERRGQLPPALPEGVHRIADLSGLLPLLMLQQG